MLQYNGNIPTSWLQIDERCVKSTWRLNILIPRQYGRHFQMHILMWSAEMFCIFFYISLDFVAKGLFDNPA